MGFEVVAELYRGTTVYGTSVGNTGWFMITKCNSNVAAVGGYVHSVYLQEVE